MEGEQALELTTHPLPDDTAGRHAFRLVAHGELDSASAEQLSAALEQLSDRGATLVVVDASGVEFIDSSGLRALVRGGNRLNEHGGRLLVEGMSGAVQRVLEISGLIETYRRAPREGEE